MNLPRIAQVVRIRPNPSEPGGSLVVVKCPFCGDPHVHGVPWQDLPKIEGHRFAHCSDPAARNINSAGYVLRTPAGFTK